MGAYFSKSKIKYFTPAVIVTVSSPLLQDVRIPEFNTSNLRRAHTFASDYISRPPFYFDLLKPPPPPPLLALELALALLAVAAVAAAVAAAPAAAVELASSISMISFSMSSGSILSKRRTS